MDVPIFVALGLGMADENNQAWFYHDEQAVVIYGFDADKAQWINK